MRCRSPAIAERVRAPVVKVIPTLAHVVGRGVSLLIAGPGAKPEHVEAVRRVFARFSVPMVIDARDDRVASNVAGSALALFAALCDAFVSANAARAETLDRPALDAMMAETAGRHRGARKGRLRLERHRARDRDPWRNDTRRRWTC